MFHYKYMTIYVVRQLYYNKTAYNNSQTQFYGYET
jgi:hypothetical protein